MSIKVISLFSGGGGLDLGFSRENYDIIWANDIDKEAVATYKYNIGNHILWEDINNIDIKRMPKADIIIGGPPCQSFSLAGKRDPNDPRGSLVWKYLEILDYLKPKAFVFENVMGLLSAKDVDNTKIFEKLKTEFKNIGYTVNAELLNSSNYGVPQKRKRVIIVGLLGEAKFEFHNPTNGKDESLISVKEALSDLPIISEENPKNKKYSSKPQNKYQKSMRKNLTEVTEQEYPQMSELDKYIAKHVTPGGNYMDIPADVNSKRIRRLQKEGGHTTCYGKMHPDKPSYTINTYFNRPNVGCNLHYKYDRLITNREALRLQGFPDDYILKCKTKRGKLNIIGNAVPPPMSKYIAKELKKYIIK